MADLAMDLIFAGEGRDGLCRWGARKDSQDHVRHHHGKCNAQDNLAGLFGALLRFPASLRVVDKGYDVLCVFGVLRKTLGGRETVV